MVDHDMVHQYAKIDIEQTYIIACEHIDDLNAFLVAVFQKTGIAG